jgi:hypothetical protein
MLTYKSTLVKTKLYCIVHQQSCLLLYVLSLPLMHPNNAVPTTVLSASASQRSQRLARSQSCSWIHRPQIWIISSWSWKPKRHELENHELKHEHSHLQYCICNSNFNTSLHTCNLQLAACNCVTMEISIEWWLVVQGWSCWSYSYL